jgi:quercetin dioxygenase-like cupin family protein
MRPKSDHLARGRVLAIATAAAASAVTTVFGQADVDAGSQARRSIVAESRFAVANAPLQAEVVQLVVDFPPDAWTSWHTHGGQAINLVLEGEITLRQPGMERPYKAGQAWTDSTGQVHAAGNTGRGKARLLTTFLLPKGAPQTTAVQDSPLEPTIVYEARFPVPVLPAEAEIVQQVADLASGWRAQRTSMGFTANMVVDGEVAYGIGAQRKEYKAGEAWSARAGTLVMEENRSASMARVFTTNLLPSGTSR